MHRVTILSIAVAFLLLAAPALAQEEPLPSGPYDPQVEPAEGGVSGGEEESGAVEGGASGEESGPEPPPTGETEPKIINIPKAKESYFVSGARPIPLTDSALRVDLGFPDVRIAWHLPMSKTFEIAPVFGVAYGLNAETAGKLALVDLRCELKWNFFKNEDISLALFADPGLQIPVWPQAGVGVVVGGPGVILDYRVIDKLRLTPAIQIPWGLYFMGKKSNFAARFPFMLRLGLEYQVSQTVNLLFHMSGGADVWTAQASEAGKVAALLRMVFGVSIRL